MNCCSAAFLSSCFSIGRAFCRSTGWPIRATFRIDMLQILYRSDGRSGVRRRNDNDAVTHTHDLDPPYRFCPVCGGALEPRVLKATEPTRLVCTRPTCGFVFYLDPKIAVGTVIRMPDDRIVLVRRAIEPGYGKWVFPGGYVDRGEEITLAAIREAREEVGTRRPHRSADQHLLVRRPRADHRRLRGDLAGRRARRCDDEGLEARTVRGRRHPVGRAGLSQHAGSAEGLSAGRRTDD